MFFSSCLKEDDNTENTTLQENSSKELVSSIISISDINGENKSSATIELFAKSQQSLDSYLLLKSFKIEASFDDENINLTDTDTDTDQKDILFEELSDNNVFIVIRDVKLEEGATGFAFHVEGNSEVNKTSSYDYVDWHHGPNWWHYGMVCMSGTTDPIRYDWYDDKGFWSTWKWSEGAVMADWGCDQHYHGDKRIKLRVKSDFQNYLVFYKHWWEDDWSPCWGGNCN